MGVSRKPAAVRSRIDWAAAAESVAATFPLAKLDPRVVAWVDKSSRSQARWGVALSGGADSVALLLLLWAHWPERRSRLRVLHFDHRLRGAESRADAVFCRELSRKLKLTFIGGAWRRPANAGHASEASARQARMEFLAAQARVLWFAHHRDDVAESLLMRISRGSGTAGLASPRPIHAHADGRTHLRPLLPLRKEEIQAALKAAGAAWRDDSSNETGTYFRNRIRRQVLPAWVEAAGRDAVAGAARSRELLQEDDDALEAWTRSLKCVGPRRELLLAPLRGIPTGVLRRALHRWLSLKPLDISRQAFDSLLAAVAAGHPTRQSLGRNDFAVIRRGAVFRESGNRKRDF